MWLVKILLSPFALIYWAITSLRNHLFDIGYTKSIAFDRLVVTVGNLSVGGTGKTPMVEYLIRLLKDQYKIATLSRGYGRKSQGFRVATTEDSAKSIGDEPYQLFLKFRPEVKVAVGEERALAISSILLDHPEVEVILLDDGFQHRTVRGGFNLLVTSYFQPFYEDHVLPMGRLREGRYGASRADAIVVTKCPEDLNESVLNKMEEAIAKYAPQKPLFFCRVKYASPQPMNTGANIQCSDHVVLVSGIASSQSLEDYVTSQFKLIKHIKYNDHHDYSAQDLMRIKDECDRSASKPVSILTTEKDIVKWLSQPLKAIIQELPVFFLPMEMEFLGGAERFNRLVLNSFDNKRDNGS